MVKVASLPHEEEFSNREKNDDLTNVNHHRAKKDGESAVFDSEESTLGALFWEFSGSLEKLPKTHSFAINNVSIPTNR